MELEQNIKDELKIDDTKLMEELLQQSSKYFFWATKKAEASAEVRTQKARLDEAKARLGREYKQNNPTVKATERVLDDYLDEHQEVRDIRGILTRSLFTEEMLEAATHAFVERHYALIELIGLKEREKMLTNEFEKMKEDFKKAQLARQK